jgi:hypothetical protein
MSDPFIVPDDPILTGLQNTMQYNAITGKPELRVNIGEGIDISGPVNIPGEISVLSSNEDPIRVKISQIGTSGILTGTNLPVSVANFPATQPVSIASMPSTPVTGTFWQATQPVSLTTLPTITGIVSVSNLPATQAVSIAALPPITGTVAISNFTEETGSTYSINNHGINSNRGWTLDNSMRPVISLRVNNLGTGTGDLMKLIEYEIGSNSNNNSTVIYEWYEGNILTQGADIPAWVNIGTRSQYRIYEDIFGSNESNTFNRDSAIMRHSGILIGRNTPSDAGPITMRGGGSPNMLTLCMKRVDSGTKIDFWFAFTIREITS